MKRIVWLADIHLNFLRASEVDEFLAQVAAERPDAVLISGDVGESHDVCDYLQQIHRALSPAAIDFVLGNHDYYRGSIVDTRRHVVELCARTPGLDYLSVLDVVPLGQRVGLVGHDGWADGRLGDYSRSLVMMQDWRLIAEFVGLDKLRRWELLKSLGDEAAAHLRRVMPLLFERYDEGYLLTHVPPVREACWHEGQISNDAWLPHFTCQAAGQAILETMAARPEKRLTVLCGHTHGAGQCRPLPNVHILTAGADYGHPAIAGVFEIE